MKSAKRVLTDQELELMKIVWRREEATVRDVYEELLEHRKVAYTTVMTVMKTLETKGYLKTAQRDRAYVYTPTQPKEQVIKRMVGDFLDRVFNGAAQPLVTHLVKDRKLSEADLREITRLMREENKK
jgi:BlaI family penicillinase repressor